MGGGNAAAASRLVYGKDDALFGSIERQQREHNVNQEKDDKFAFGRILDAGTGLHSLRWLATLCGDKNNDNSNDNEEAMSMTHCVAVTADTAMQRNCQREVDALGVSQHVDVVMGNWFANDPTKQPLHQILQRDNKDNDDDEDLLFDVILADYLIGAMDGFSPYTQDLIIPKLVQWLKPGGRLYLVGLQPIPDTSPDDTDADLICQVRRVRDACIMLAGHRCYREYPVDWVQRQVQRCLGLQLKHTSRFSILYKQETIAKQINVARSKLSLFPSLALSEEMAEVLDDLEAKTAAATQRRGRIPLGFDYIVTADKEKTTTTTPNEEKKTTTVPNEEKAEGIGDKEVAAVTEEES